MKTFVEYFNEKIIKNSFGLESEKQTFAIKELNKRSEKIDEMFSDHDAFCIMEDSMLLEKLMTFGGKAYPKFGNVVIMCGGTGSGKGFTIKNLLGIEGKIFDVDKLKSLSINSTNLAAKILKETGYDIKTFDLRKSEEVSKLHLIIKNIYHFQDKNERQFFNSLVTIMFSKEEMKPNIIFDVTLNSVKKLHEISVKVVDMGYKKENIHIVWVLTDIEVAIEQNAKRKRVVDNDILLQNHQGVSITMKKLLSNSESLRKWIDGDFYISASVTGDDIESKSSNNGGHFISKASYFKIKKQGEEPKSIKQLSKIIIGKTNLLNKIKSYTPKIDTWE